MIKRERKKISHKNDIVTKTMRIGAIRVSENVNIFETGQ
jgi:hypothetical protein